MTVQHRLATNLLSHLLTEQSQAQQRPQPELFAIPTPQLTESEPIRHILLGSPGGIRQTIHLLHTLRYVENALWSPLVPIPNEQLIITPKQGDVMSILIKHVH